PQGSARDARSRRPRARRGARAPWLESRGGEPPYAGAPLLRRSLGDRTTVRDALRPRVDRVLARRVRAARSVGREIARALARDRALARHELDRKFSRPPVSWKLGQPARGTAGARLPTPQRLQPGHGRRAQGARNLAESARR